MYKSGDINPEILRRWIHMPGITAIDFDANTTTVAASSFRTMVCLFNFDPRKRTLLMAGNDVALSDVCFNKEATFVATCGANTIAQVFEASTRSGGSGFSEYNCHSKNVNSVDFSNDTSCLLTASADNYVRIIDLQRRVPVVNFLGHFGVVRCARFCNSDSFFVSGGEDKVVNIWDSRVNRVINFFFMDEKVSKVAISPTDRMVAAVTAKGIAMYDTRVLCKHLQQYFPEKDEDFVSASFHAEKPWALVGQSNGTVIVADVFAGRPVFEMSHLMAKLTDAKFSKCGKYFAVSGKDPQSQVSLYAVKREQKPFYICEDSASATPKSVYYKRRAAHPERKSEIKANKMSNQPNWRPRKWSKTKQLGHSSEVLPRVANKRNEDLIVVGQKKELVVRSTRTKLDCTPPPLSVPVKAKSNPFEKDLADLFSNLDSDSVESETESSVTGLKGDGSDPVVDLVAVAEDLFAKRRISAATKERLLSDLSGKKAEDSISLLNIKAAARALIDRDYFNFASSVAAKLSILSKTEDEKHDHSTPILDVTAASQALIAREDAGSGFNAATKASIFSITGGKKSDSSTPILDVTAAAQALMSKGTGRAVGLDLKAVTKANFFSKTGSRKADGSTSTSDITAAAQTGITREDAGQVAGSNFKSLAKVSILTKPEGKKRDSSILIMDKKAAARAVITEEENDQPVGLDFETSTKAAIVSEDEGNKLVEQPSGLNSKMAAEKNTYSKTVSDNIFSKTAAKYDDSFLVAPQPHAIPEEIVLESQLESLDIRDETDKPTTSKSAFNAGLATKREAKAEQERKNIYGEIQELCERYSTYLESSYYSKKVVSHQIRRIMHQLESDNLRNKSTEILQNLRKFLIKLGTFLKVYDSEMENYAIALADEVDKLECD